MIVSQKPLSALHLKMDSRSRASHVTLHPQSFLVVIGTKL
jgi:hypothetical protein